MEGYTIFGAISLLTFILPAALSVFLPHPFPGFPNCTSNPCQNGGTCNQRTYEYTCNCTTQFMGSNCEKVPPPIVSPDTLEPALHGHRFCIGSDTKEVGVNMQTNYMIRYEFNQTQGLPVPNITYIRVGFMTRKKYGILLQVNNDNGEFVSLQLNNIGGVKLAVDLGFLRFQLNTEFTDFHVDLTNGQPHEVIMRRENTSEIFLQVDNYRPVQGQLGWTMIDPTIIDSPKFLYIGNNVTWSTANGFEGCIYGAQIDDFYPLKLAFQEPRPSYIVATPSDHILEKVCGAEAHRQNGTRLPDTSVVG